MDGILIALLVIVGGIALWDKGRHRWLAYAWFVLLGFFLGWVSAGIYIVYFMRF